MMVHHGRRRHPYRRHYHTTTPTPSAPPSRSSASREGLCNVSGLYMLITPKGQVYFLADTTVNIEPTAEDLAEIAILAAETARELRRRTPGRHALFLELRLYAPSAR